MDAYAHYEDALTVEQDLYVEIRPENGMGYVGNTYHSTSGWGGDGEITDEVQEFSWASCLCAGWQWNGDVSGNHNIQHHSVSSGWEYISTQAGTLTGAMVEGLRQGRFVRTDGASVETLSGSGTLMQGTNAYDYEFTDGCTTVEFVGGLSEEPELYLYGIMNPIYDSSTDTAETLLSMFGDLLFW